MDMLLETINKAGLKFVEFASPMLVQSSLLILILLAADFLLRKKVRSVFRYWIWMLVLIKLLLPVSLYSPLSLGSWFGEKIEYANIAQEDTGQKVFESENMRDIKPVTQNIWPIEPRVGSTETAPSESHPAITNTAPVATETAVSPVVTETGTKISWQAVIFLIWITVAAGLGLVLLKRTVFINELVTKASDIDFSQNDSPSPEDVLKHCCLYLGLKKQIPLKISPDATSPVVCGLFRPVILLPQNLISSLNPGQLKAIFFHELAHIKRGDLWVNLLQTVLQIIYFYNPLFWLANSIIRRTREQAVDEMALVAMGKDAGEYPETLVNVAKLAFKRPALSLRLIGVVESEDALSGRIKHILNRPLPKSAKLGLLGLLIIIIFAALMLPMAKKTNSDYFVDTTKGYIRCDSDISELGRILVNMAYMYEFKQEFASSTGFGNDESPVKYSTTNYIIPDNKKLSIEAVAEKNQPLIIQIDLEPGALYSLAEITTELARQLGIFSKAVPLINKSETSLSIELLGVSEHPSENNKWWKPDGSLLDKKPYDTARGGRTVVHNNSKAYEFVVRTDLPESFDMTWKAEPSEETYMTSFLKEKDNTSKSDLCVLVAVFPEGQKSCSLEINTESWFTLVKVTENQRSYAFGDFTARVIPPKYEDGKYVIRVQEADKEFDNRYKRRYVIKLKDSDKLINLESLAKQTSYNEGELRPIETIYTLDSGYNPDNIEYIAAQYGFTQTFTFKNVSLAAQHKTNVQTSSSGIGHPSFIYADLNKPPVPRLTELHTGVVKDKKQLYFHSIHPQTLWQRLSKDKQYNPKWYFRINGVDYPLGLSGQFAHSRYEKTEAFGFPHDLKDKDKQWLDGDYSLSVVIKDTVWLDPKGKRHYYKELVTDPIEFKIQDSSFLSKTGQSIPGFSPKASLPNYGTIELVGVRKRSLPDQPWYAPDGLQKLDSSYEIFSHLTGTSGVINAPGTQTYEFFIHCALPYNDGKVVKNKWSFEPEKGIPGAFFTSFSSGRYYFTASVALPETLNKTNLTFSVSNGLWKTIADSDGENEKGISITHRGQTQDITLGEIVEKDGSVFIEVTHKIKEMAARIIVFDKNNKVRYPLDNVLDYADSDGNILVTKCKFDGMTKDEIGRYEFQIQPVDIVTFKDISLKNEFYTNPEITTTSITDKTPIKDTATENTEHNSMSISYEYAGLENIKITDVPKKDYFENFIKEFFKMIDKGDWDNVQKIADIDLIEEVSPNIPMIAHLSELNRERKAALENGFNMSEIEKVFVEDNDAIALTGIYKDDLFLWYYFQKINGKWKLRTLANSDYAREKEEIFKLSREHLGQVDETKEAGNNSTRQSEVSWGQDVEGAQIRLVNAGQIWERSDWPHVVVRLQLEARNNGQRYLHLPENGIRWQIEVDDQWYEWVPPEIFNPPDDVNGIDGPGSVLLDFNSGNSYDNLKVEIAGNWRQIPRGKEIEFAMRQYSGSGWLSTDGEYGSELVLKSGRHKIRTAITCPPSKRINIIDSPVRLISNAIEYEVLPIEQSEVNEIRELSENYFSALRRMDSGRAAELIGNRGFADVSLDYVSRNNLSMMIYPKIAYLSNKEALLISAALESINKEEEPQEMRIGLRYGNGKWTGYFVEMGIAGNNGKIENFLNKYPDAKAIEFVPPEVPDDNEVPWGQAIEEIQIRARMDRQWHEGQIPNFLVDVRNNGTEDLDLVLAPEWWELELDGLWYKIGAWYSGVVPVMSLDAGARQNSIELLPTERWEWHNNRNPLKFSEGKHEVRLALTVFRKDPNDKRSTRVLSNPIEFEVLPGIKNSEGESNINVTSSANEDNSFSSQVKKAWEFKANEGMSRQTGKSCISFDIKYKGVPDLYYTDPNIVMSYQIKSLTMNDVPMVKKGNGGLVSIWNPTGSGIIRRPEEVEGLEKLKPGTYPVKLELEGDIYKNNEPNNILEHWELEINREIKLTQLIFLELGIPQTHADFNNLTIELSGTWLALPNPIFRINGNGTVEFSAGKSPNNPEPYKTTFYLRQFHLDRLNKLLEGTKWLTQPGANVEPAYTDATRIDMTLERNGGIEKAWCHDRNPEPYKALINFIMQLYTQEDLLKKLTVGPDSEKVNVAYQLRSKLQAVKGEKVAAGEQILNYHRFKPVCREIINDTDNYHREVIVAALEILAYVRDDSQWGRIYELTRAKQTASDPSFTKEKTIRVQVAAVNAFAEIVPPDFSYLIRELAKEYEQNDWKVNDAIVEAMFRLNGKISIDLFKSMLSTTPSAGWALIRLGEPAIPAIVDILEEMRPEDPENIGQIHLIRQYIDNWEKVPKPVDERVINVVKENLVYRNGGDTWTQYHREFLKLVNATEPNYASVTQVTEQFLLALQNDDERLVKKSIQNNITDWQVKFKDIKKLPNLKKLKVVDVFTNQKEFMAFATCFDRGNLSSYENYVFIFLNLNNKVWRVSNTAVINSSEVAERYFKSLQGQYSDRKSLPEPGSITQVTNKLDFRIIPEASGSGGNPIGFTSQEVGQYLKALEQNGPNVKMLTNDYVWLELDENVESSLFIKQKYQDKLYVLTSNKKSEIMLDDGSWSMNRANRNREDNFTNRYYSVSSRLDEYGDHLLSSLTNNNIGKNLAVVANGKIIFVSKISRIMHEVTITGDFSEAQAGSWMYRLDQFAQAQSERRQGQIITNVENNGDEEQIKNVVVSLWRAVDANDAKRVSELYYRKLFEEGGFDSSALLRRLANDRQSLGSRGNDISKIANIEIREDKAIAKTSLRNESFIYYFIRSEDKWFLCSSSITFINEIGPKHDFFSNWPRTKLDNEAFTEYLEAGKMLHEGADRIEVAERLTSIAKLYPFTDKGKTCAELGMLLTQMVEEDKNFVEPQDLQQLSEQERIDYYIYKLRDVAEREFTVPGKCHVLRYPKTPDSAAVALREMDTAVVPAMISLLEDLRLTRSVGLDRNGGVVLRNCDIALEIIESIADRKFDFRTTRGSYLSTASEDLREKIIEDVKSWWGQNKNELKPFTRHCESLGDEAISTRLSSLKSSVSRV